MKSQLFTLMTAVVVSIMTYFAVIFLYQIADTLGVRQAETLVHLGVGLLLGAAYLLIKRAVDTQSS